jgi:hypothetical protein
MIEFVQLPVQSLGLEHGDLTAALWFGTGLTVGLVLALASFAAIAIECVRNERPSL